LPTYETLRRFQKDWEKLGNAERAAFRAAVAAFIQALSGGQGRYPSNLRVHRIDSTHDVWSLSFGRDGRATFQFGEGVTAGEPHIVWRRIGHTGSTRTLSRLTTSP
jgi:hypothetical protein